MKNESAQQLGKRGGQKTAERGRDYYASIGRKGAAKRWKKKFPIPDWYSCDHQYSRCSKCDTR